MKNLFHIIVCVSAFLAVSSCGSVSTGDSHQDTKESISGETDLKEMKKKIADLDTYTLLLGTKIDSIAKALTQAENVTAAVEKQDTLMNAFILAKLDTLAQAIEQVQTRTAALEQAEESKDADGVWNKLSLAALVLAIVSLVLTIFLFWKRISEEEINGIFKHNLDDSQRVKKLQDDVAHLKDEREKINRQIKEVLDSRPRIDKTPRPSQSISEPSHSAPTPSPATSRSGGRPSEQPKCKQPRYFGKKYMKNNTDKYFTEILDSDQEVCAFFVEFTSEDQHQGEFSIISLDRIKSKDGWEKVVDCTGCSKADATSFTVLERGICVETNGLLEVTKNLKIELIK